MSKIEFYESHIITIEDIPIELIAFSLHFFHFFNNIKNQMDLRH